MIPILVRESEAIKGTFLFGFSLFSTTDFLSFLLPTTISDPH